MNVSDMRQNGWERIADEYVNETTYAYAQT